MKYDQYGQVIATEQDLISSLHRNPDQDITDFYVDAVDQYNHAIDSLHLSWPKLSLASNLGISIDEFDSQCQQQWFMPESYQNLDIAAWVLDQCQSQAELQRCGQELLMYQERNLFDLLKYLKYLVDTMRDKCVVWGVGRGSSVASFVLYKIGVHRINSLYYDLPIEEFLKE
jgi:DNA polymerase III alpha subunit